LKLQQFIDRLVLKCFPRFDLFRAKTTTSADITENISFYLIKREKILSSRLTLEMEGVVQYILEC